jgi:hypothetical protein
MRDYSDLVGVVRVLSPPPPTGSAQMGAGTRR